jgi:hypothetical protein
MPLFSSTGITTVCDKCGAAMVLIGVWPISAEDLEVRMFRCEICANSAFYKKQLQNAQSRKRNDNDSGADADQ